MRIFTYLFIVLVFSLTLFAQNTDEVKTTIGGYVKTELFYDTQESVVLREGNIYLYPANTKKDKAGEIYNTNLHFNILPIQTRVFIRSTGHEVLGGKAQGFIEAEFLGTTEADINSLRLRHAFLKIDWNQFSILLGQTWHPFLVTEVLADVASFNTGLPFQPFSRNPQIKIFYRFGNNSLVASLLAERDFTSTGPNGGSSSYLRNSAMPIFDLQYKYLSKDFVFGFGGNYKTLVPRLLTDKGYKTNEKTSSMAALAFAKYSVNDLTFKLAGSYGENMFNLLMLGGYAVKSYDTTYGYETYTNLKTMAVWGEITYGKDFNYGVFAGYTQNLGSSDEIYKGKVFARGSDIHSVMRVTPHVSYRYKSVQFSAEIEHTIANYGAADSKGVVKNYEKVPNTRFLLASFIYF